MIVSVPNTVEEAFPELLRSSSERLCWEGSHVLRRRRRALFRAVWLQFASCFISEDISTSGSDSSEPIEREREKESDSDFCFCFFGL